MNDKKLILAIRQGDILAFEALVKRYQQKLLVFTLRIINNEADAEEVVQDTFVKVYGLIDRVDLEQKFSTYLFEIAKNGAISRLRQVRANLPLEKAYSVAVADETVEKLIRAEDAHKVRRAIKRLPARHGRALGLYYFNDLSYQEIAHKIGVPLNTVRTYIHRAKQALRKDLAQNGEG